MAQGRTLSLSLGVELELLVRPKSTDTIRKYQADIRWPQPGRPKGAFRGKMHELVCKVLQDTDIPVVLGESSDYKAWSVIGDASLVQGENDGFYSVELVSKILFTDGGWLRQVDTILSRLHEHFEVVTDKHCGTHGHVSPQSVKGRMEEWSLQQLQDLLKCLCLFDNQVTAMLPVERRGNPYCTSFLSGRNAAQALQPYHAKILQTGKYDDLFRFIDSLTTTEAIAGIFQGRYYYANFQSLVTAKKTIEFRCPPGSPNAADATHWILLVLSFVYGALERGRYGFGAMTRSRITYNTYLEFIRAGHRAIPAAAKRGAILIDRHLASHGEGPSMTDRESRRFTREAKKLSSAGR